MMGSTLCVSVDDSTHKGEEVALTPFDMRSLYALLDARIRNMAWFMGDMM